jgi:integrase
MTPAADGLAAGHPFGDRSRHDRSERGDLLEDGAVPALGLHSFKHPSLQTLISLSFKVVETERRAGMASRLRRFAEGRGIEDPSAMSDPDLIEAFVTTGLPGARPSTRGTYRSVLTWEPDRTGRPRVATPFQAADAVAPYSIAERATFVAVARAQRSPVKATSALAMVAFGIGAGTRPRELVALRGGDVVTRKGHVTVGVAGRVVPITTPWAEIAVELGAFAADGFVFRPGSADRTQKNFVADLADRLVADPEVPRLVVSRCRSSFFCDHLAAGTPLAELCVIAGIGEVGSLLRYARLVPGAPCSKGELRARVAAGN